MILVDTNVLSDVVTDDAVWCDWSLAHLEAASIQGKLAIVDVIYAELAVRYDRIENLDEVLQDMDIEIVPMTRPALFVAAKAFKAHRARGGTRTGVLPDFFIGAQAAVSRMSLLTRDATRYRTYFPTLTLIAP